MKRFGYTFLFSLLLLFFGCSSEDPTSPQGPSFESLSAIPTAEELSTSLLNAFGIDGSASRKTIRNLLIRKALDLHLEVQSQSGAESSCPNGGTAVYSTTSSDSSEELNIELQNCAVSISLLNEDLSVALGGELAIVFDLKDDPLYDVRNTVSLTSTGDLAFGVACELLATDVQAGQLTERSNLTGSCVFLDSNRRRIEGSAKGLVDQMFLSR